MAAKGSYAGALYDCCGFGALRRSEAVRPAHPEDCGFDDGGRLPKVRPPKAHRFRESRSRAGHAVSLESPWTIRKRIKFDIHLQRVVMSQYGGEIAILSPFNAITSTPPKIFKGNTFIGYLTTNRVKLPRVDQHALIEWLKASQSCVCQVLQNWPMYISIHFR